MAMVRVMIQMEIRKKEVVQPAKVIWAARKTKNHAKEAQIEEERSPVLNADRFVLGGRRSSILDDEDIRRPMMDLYRRESMMYSHLCIRPPLDKARIDTVLAFCNKFNAETAFMLEGSE